MSNTSDIYRCASCGAMVEVIEKCSCGDNCCTHTCCGKPMVLLKENTTDAAVEKHVPVIEKSGSGILVRVGEVPHPMAEDHYITWIEVACGPVIMRKKLLPGDAPEAFFEIPYCEDLTAREFCNKHGLWKKK